jgi:hypothetical protein
VNRAKVSKVSPFSAAAAFFDRPLESYFYSPSVRWCRRIAASRAGTVIAVSCNAATFARDARILVDGGYKLETVTPIDQFRHTPHVEAGGAVYALNPRAPFTAADGS